MSDSAFLLGKIDKESPRDALELTEDFKIGGWLVQPRRRRLSTADRAITVKPRSMAVLVALAHADGEVLTKQALMAQIWGDAEVTEDVLTQSIVELRRALGDDARNPSYIETVPRVGFRLMQAAERPRSSRLRHWAAGAAAVAAFVLTFAVWLATDTVPDQEPSVAVLPFANLSEDPVNQHFGDGLAEELLNALAQLPGLRVPARTSSFAYRDQSLDVREIGKRLGVRYVLEGSVRRDGDSVRITTQLIDVDDGYHRWSQTYERELSSVFRVQEDIAQSVVQAIAPDLVTSPSLIIHTSSPDAYDRYLAGRFHLQQGRAERARALFAAALAVDPGYAHAHAGLAEALAFFAETPVAVRQSEPGKLDRREQANAAAERALSIAPDLAEAHAAAASVAALIGDFRGEATALRAALAANPAFVDAHVRLGLNLAGRFRYTQARAAYQTAFELDPLNPNVTVALANLAMLLEGYDAAIAYPQRLIELGVASPAVLQSAVTITAAFGRYVDRIRYALALVAAEPDAAWSRAELADAYTELGELALADAWIRSAEQVSTVEAFKARARWHAAAGDMESMREISAKLQTRLGPISSTLLTPEQAGFAGIVALGAFDAGDYGTTAHLTELIITSPSLTRRLPDMRVYAEALQTRALAADGQAGRAASIAQGARQFMAALTNAEATAYPRLSYARAVLLAAAGDTLSANRAFALSVEQGWRSWRIEQHGLADLLDVPANAARIRAIEADLTQMRERARRAGLLRAPEAITAPS